MEENEVSEVIKLHAERIRILLAYRISIMFLLLFSTLTYAYSLDSFESSVMMFTGVLVSLFSLIYHHFTKNYQLVFYVYSTLGVFFTSYALIFFHETVHLVDILWLLAAVLLAFFSIGRRWGIILMTTSLLAITFFVVYSLNINIETVLPRTNYQKFTLILELVSGFFINFYLVNLFMNNSQFSELKLKELNQQLIAQNSKISLQNDEKTTLVKEIHHRVKNNLQIVVSLLRLQIKEIESEDSKKHFQESINRVMAMALLHQKLYQNESLSQIKFKEYAEDLFTSILRSNAINHPITYSIESGVDKIGLKSMIPVGLILNELVSNSLKHAFDTNQVGLIQLNVQEGKNGAVILTYRDNGSWKCERNATTSFGLVLVETLVEQLEGKLEITRTDEGTTFTLHLQKSDD